MAEKKVHKSATTPFLETQGLSDERGKARSSGGLWDGVVTCSAAMRSFVIWPGALAAA